MHIGAVEDNILLPKAKALGKYCVAVHPSPQAQMPQVCDDKLDIFSNGAFDYAYVEKIVEVIPHLKQYLGDVCAKVKMGGHVIFHLPINDPEPNILWRFEPETLKQVLSDYGTWQQKAEYLKDGEMLSIFKKLSSRTGEVKPIKPTPGKRACVIRYGAVGDSITMTPLIRKLKEDGYHVTVNCTPYCATPLENNPYIDNLLLQERDAIFNPDLGNYWRLWGGEYERYINLSESVEGALLKVEGRPDFYTPQAYRHSIGNRNYYDFTMERGGYPEVRGTKGELFFNHQERKEIDRFLAQYKGKFVVVWALNGSSYHKMYPLMQPVVETWCKDHPETLVLTVGDNMSKMHEFKHPNVLNCAGEWPLRKVLCLTGKAACVVGPETAVLNAAGCYDTPKIVFLSHSTPENLTKYWTNTIALEPDKCLAPCYPCHQLHYTKDSCPQAAVTDQEGKEIVKGPVCAMGAIQPERVLQALSSIHSQWVS